MWFPNKKLSTEELPPQAEGDPLAGDKDPFAGVSFEESPELPDANVSILVETIEVPETEIHDLLDLQTSADSTTMRKAIGGLINDGTATISEAQFACTQSTSKTRIHSGDERLYPVEMSSPSMPIKIAGPIGPGQRLAIPTTFSSHVMRIEGLELEVAPQVGPDNHTIELSLAIATPNTSAHAPTAKAFPRSPCRSLPPSVRRPISSSLMATMHSSASPPSARRAALTLTLTPSSSCERHFAKTRQS